MANCYNLDGVKKSIEKEIDRYQCMKKEWESVKFPTKKNGEPFSIMSKNFENATYFGSTYLEQGYKGKVLNPTLKVCFNTKLSGYCNDELFLYKYVKYMDNNKFIDKREKNTFNDVYIYDLEDIKQAVNDRIDYLEKYIVSLKRQLEIADNAYNTFREAYKNAMEVLNNVTETTEDTYSTLKSNIRDTIKEHYPYC